MTDRTPDPDLPDPDLPDDGIPDDDAPDHGVHLEAPAPPPGVLDRAVDAAMVAFDEVRGDAASTGDGHTGNDNSSSATVHALEPRRRDQPWFRRVPLGAVAAAVVVVAMVGVFTQVDLADDGDDAATAADAGDAVEGAADDLTQEGPSADDGADESFDTTDGVPSSRRIRGVYPDIASFADDLRDAPLESGETESSDDAGASDAPATTVTTRAVACDAVAASGVDPGAVEDLVPALVDGREVIGVVYDADGRDRLAVVDVVACTLDADIAL